MTLYIKQKVFSFKDKFAVADDQLNTRYSVEGEFFTWGKRLHVYGADGAEVALVRQKVWSWKPRFFVEIGGQEVLQIVKEFTFLKPKYTLSGECNWHIQGDIWSHEYEIVDDSGRMVMWMHKHWFTWGDSYELQIERDGDELMCVCAVLAIDAALAAEAAAAASSSS